MSYALTPERVKRRQEAGEVICGGYIVLGRDNSMRLTFNKPPFEWATRDAALAEAERLATLFPSKGFHVFAVTDGVIHPKTAEGAKHD
jgi:hypothetical protein